MSQISLCQTQVGTEIHKVGVVLQRQESGCTGTIGNAISLVKAREKYIVEGRNV